jgi:nucleotide-binding universal stress UspA family protein
MFYMVSKILVAVDGSAMSLAALRTAITWAKGWNAEIHAVYVIDPGDRLNIPPQVVEGGLDPAYERSQEMLHLEAKEIEGRLDEISQETGSLIQKHLRFGDPRQEILELARNMSPDLLFFGSRGMSRIERLRIGSVGSYIVEHSPVTTVLVRE